MGRESSQSALVVLARTIAPFQVRFWLTRNATADQNEQKKRYSCSNMPNGSDFGREHDITTAPS